MIGVVAIEQPAVIMIDNIAEPPRIDARQIGIDRLDAIDAEIGTILQFEYVLVAGEVPGLRDLRPMHRIEFTQRLVIWIGILNRRSGKQAKTL